MLAKDFRFRDIRLSLEIIFDGMTWRDGGGEVGYNIYFERGQAGEIRAKRYVRDSASRMVD